MNSRLTDSNLGYGLARARLGRRKRQTCESRERLRACPVHDRRTMVLNGALADVKICGDVFVGVTREHEVHDLALSRREARNVVRSRLLPSR